MKGREWKILEHSVINGKSPWNHSHPCRKLCWRRVWESIRANRDRTKQRGLSRHHRTDTRMNSRWLSQHAHGLHRCIPVGVSVLRGEATQSAIPNLSSTDNHSQMKNWCFPWFSQKLKTKFKSRFLASHRQKLTQMNSVILLENYFISCNFLWKFLPIYWSFLMCFVFPFVYL